MKFVVRKDIKMIKFYLILTVAILSVLAKNEVYKGYKVYNVKLNTEEQQNNYHILRNDELDVWRYPSFEHGIVGRVMVPPSRFVWFEEKLMELNIDVDVSIEDVYQYLLEKENENEPLADERDDSREFNFARYYRYDEILTYLRDLEASYADSSTITVELVEYGQTAQNRPLVYLKISSSIVPAPITEPKPIVIIEAGIIAREWITIPAAIKVINNILDVDQPRFLTYYDWIVIPVVNPDGYEHSHTERVWRKSMSITTNLGFICPGVNINRNFDVAWGVSNASSSPCSYLFAGNAAFSEIESQMIRSLVDTYASRVRLYISLQNNGGIVSYPWYYEKAATALFIEHHLLALDMINAMNSSNYILGVASVMMDSSSGTSSDYWRINGVRHTYNIDIVHSDNNDFVIPAENIEGIVNDVWNGIVVAVDKVL